MNNLETWNRTPERFHDGGALSSVPATMTIKISEDAKETPLYKEPSQNEGVIYLACVAVRFGAFLASQGVKPGEECFVLRSYH